MGRSRLAFIFITIFVDMLGYGIVVPLLPFYVQEFVPGGAAVGLLGSLYALMQFAGGPLLGALSDQYGRRPLLLICLLGTAAGYTLLGLAGSLWMVILALMVDGLTGGNATTAQAYIADSTTAEDRAWGMGLFGAAFGLGLMLGPTFGGLLSQYGLHVPAFAAAGIALANAIYGLFFLPESLPPERRHPPSLAALNPLRQLGAVMRLQSIRGLLMAIFTLNLAFAGLQSNFPLFSEARFGWDVSRNAYFFAFVGICAVVAQGVLLGRLQPIFGETRLALAGLALMALNLLLMSITYSPLGIYPVVGLVALGSSLSIPSLTSLISQRVSDREQGTVMGGTQSILSLTMIIGPTMAGLAFDSAGAGAPYALGGVLAAGALAAAWYTLAPAAERPADRMTNS